MLDTNILISALMIQMGNPAAIYPAWQERHFTLLTCAEHLDELRATLRKPAIAERIKPYKTGGLGRAVNHLRRAEMMRMVFSPAVAPPAAPDHEHSRRAYGRKTR